METYSVSTPKFEGANKSTLFFRVDEHTESMLETIKEWTSVDVATVSPEVKGDLVFRIVHIISELSQVQISVTFGQGVIEQVEADVRNNHLPPWSISGNLKGFRVKL